MDCARKPAIAAPATAVGMPGPGPGSWNDTIWPTALSAVLFLGLPQPYSLVQYYRAAKGMMAGGKIRSDRSGADLKPVKSGWSRKPPQGKPSARPAGQRPTKAAQGGADDPVAAIARAKAKKEAAAEESGES